MAEKQETDIDQKRNRLTEIYKLQVQQANNISNRRTVTNRFYLLVMSALAVIFSTFIRQDDQVPFGLQKVVPVEWIIAIFGMLGITLSWIWCLSINSYLRVNSRKYEALKEMEHKLEYNFFETEWKYLGDQEKKKTYWHRSRIELTTPGFFFGCFVALMLLGLYRLPEKNFFLFMFYPIILLSIFIEGSVRWSKIEKSFNEGDEKNGKMDG